LTQMVTACQNKQRKKAEDEEKHKEERPNAFEVIEYFYANKRRKEAEDEEKHKEERQFVSKKELREEETIQVMKKCLKMEAFTETAEEQATEQPRDEEEKEASEEETKKINAKERKKTIISNVLGEGGTICSAVGLALLVLFVSTLLASLLAGVRIGSIPGMILSDLDRFEKSIVGPPCTLPPDPPKPNHTDIPDLKDFHRPEGEKWVPSLSTTKKIFRQMELDLDKGWCHSDIDITLLDVEDLENRGWLAEYIQSKGYKVQRPWGSNVMTIRWCDF